MIDDKKLDFYIEHDYNVLMRGRHGVGKTAIIKAAFERAGLNWKYFSASTMDPWVDFVGVPEKVTDEDGRSYIDLVRPKNFQNDEVEAIFLDEFNRAKPKVRNAVMELIQFKSINGVPFRNLRMIWCAINPEDDEADLHYDVEELDEAQKDRFQIILDIPYEPSRAYFVRRFGEEVGGGAVEWWKGLEPEHNVLVSPRRLEYALDVYSNEGDLRDVLPFKELNLQQLRQRIQHGSIASKLEQLYDASDIECQKTFNNMNFVTDAKEHIFKEEHYIKRFGKFIHKDILAEYVTDPEGVYREAIINNVDAEVIVPVLSNIVTSQTTKRPIRDEITKLAQQRGLDLTSETSFKNAISDAAKHMEDNTSRYSGLQAVYKNYNSKASKDTLNDCLAYLGHVIVQTSDEALKNSKKPYHQIGVDLCHRLNTALSENHNTDLMSEWGKIKDSHKYVKKIDASRKEKIEKFLELYLDTPPKKK